MGSKLQASECRQRADLALRIVQHGPATVTGACGVCLLIPIVGSC